MLKNDVFPKFRISDQYLIENNILKKSDLASIQLKRLHDEIQVEDIKQGLTGNCYLLAALASIVENDPHALDDIIKITEEGVEVTLHDASDPDKVFTYVIDPTKVMLSNHTHDAIFIIEKAYAIHRIIKEKKFNKNEIIVLEKLHDNKFDVDKTLNNLSEFKIHSIKVTKEYINNVKQKHDKYLDYIEALNEGSSADVYTSLLGVKSAKEIIPNDCNIEYLFTDFMTSIIYTKNEVNGWEKESREKKILIKIFGSLNSQEALLFLDAITPQLYLEAANILNDYIDAKKSKSSFQEQKAIHETIKNLFDKALLNRDDSDSELVKSTILKFNAFVDQEVPYKRGLGIYTPSQLEAYSVIKGKLQNSQLVSLCSQKKVGRNQNNQKIFAGEPVSKGLAGGHAYHVVNCYERNNLKFILIRNPWGRYVRDYKTKNKTVGGKKVKVLSAYEKNNTNPIFSQVTSFFSNPRISQPALPLNDKNYHSSYMGNGYIELELSDLTKRFKFISYTCKSEANNQNLFI